jgi:ABC-type branched-subunit amino acid transport system substrate-binding protein
VTFGALSPSTASAATSSTPIVVGGTSSLGTTAGIASGFRAGLYRFNRAGGLNGRKVQFTGVLDDGFSGSTSLSNAQLLVESKHVMAVMPIDSVVNTTETGNFLATSKVPFIGWATSSAYSAQPTWGYGITGNSVSPSLVGLTQSRQILAATGNAKTPSKVRIGLIAENIAQGIAPNNALAKAMSYVGMKVVYRGAPIAILGTTTYAPYAQALISSGANVVFETLDSPDSVGLAAALKQAGYKGMIVNALTYYPGQLASEPTEAAALNGVYVVNPFPLNQNNTPAVKQAESDLVSTGQKPYLTAGVSQGYWSAILFEQMLKSTLKSVGGDPNKVTGAALQKVVAGPGGFTYIDPIPGGIGNETFPAASKVPTGCGTLVKTVGTNFKQIAPYQCLGVLNVVKLKKVNPMTGKIISIAITRVSVNADANKTIIRVPGTTADHQGGAAWLRV